MTPPRPPARPNSCAAEQFIIGEPDDVVRKVGPLIDAGLDCLIFNMPLSQPDAVARAGKLLTSTFS